MAETITIRCHDLIITRTQPKLFNWADDDQLLGVLVHDLIVTKFIKVAQHHGFQIHDPVWDYPIRIGDKVYPMKLLWIKGSDRVNEDTKLDLILNSRFSFPWEDELTGFHMTREKFHLVEEFIHKNNLKSHIRAKYSDTSLTFAPDEITVVEFHNTVPNDIIPKFGQFMNSNEYLLSTNFYIRFCFRYLNPVFMRYYDKPFYNPCVITQVLLLLDYHRHQTRQGNEIFDICDLIAMKMAIDDNRLEYENCEFHKLLDKMFREMAESNEYIEARCFNLAEYRTNKGIIFVSEEILEYLMYNFCSHFDSVALYWSTKINIKLSKINVDKLIATIHRYAHIYIDGTHIDKRSADVLMKIITNFAQSNVFLHFDTGSVWQYAGDDNTIYSAKPILSCKLMFVGRNTCHFIENFINWLKLSLGSKTEVMDFVIVGAKSLQPYILRDFCVRKLTIHDMELNYKLIDALAFVKYENIRIKQCRLGTDPNIFAALEKLHNVQEVAINFQDSIGNIMIMLENRLATCATKRLRFRFSFILYDANNLDLYIDLEKFDFYANCDRTQIINYDRRYKCEVYLYDYLYDQSIFVSRDEFEFYT